MSERGPGGIWSLESDRLTSVAEQDSGSGVVLVRSEHVLVLALPLPPMPNASRRRAALPFAVEDRIADPLDQVHVALGQEIAPGIWLAGVVRHELMAQWTLRLAEAGLERASIVPDALALPVPGQESWSVDIAAGRAMVRAPDGTGFAMPLGLLEAAWRAAGEPMCIAYGDPLPPHMQGPSTGLEIASLAQRLTNPALDLRQGLYAAPRRPAHPLWRRVAIVAALGAAAHGAIAIADTLALDGIAARREAEVRALAGLMQPDLVIGPDLSAALTDMTPDAASSGPSQFLSLLSRTGAALQGSQTPIGWRSLAFDRVGRTLTIEVETSDIAGLQQVAQALTRGGLTAQPGAASTDQDHAVGTFVVRAS
ncbi:MAG: type II secretion system protein GspL [Novosphingobium sp.]